MEASDLDVKPAEQPEPSRSEKLLAAGYKPRDRRLTCDECGEKVSAQMMPLHECKPLPELPKVQLTTEQAIKLAETIWWQRNLHSREGLTHLFPGLRKK